MSAWVVRTSPARDGSKTGSGVAPASAAIIASRVFTEVGSPPPPML
jgi:hypothetical protein